jgi:hypothetical protein
VTFAYGVIVPPLTQTVKGDGSPVGANGGIPPLAVILASPVTTKTEPLVGGLNVGQLVVSTVSKETAASFMVM